MPFRRPCVRWGDDGLTGAYLKATGKAIAYNGSLGIAAESGFALRNSIHSNGAEGMRFWSEPPDYVPPVVQAASRTDGKLTISGTVNAPPRRFGYVSATLTRHLSDSAQTFGFSNCLSVSGP